MAKKDNEQQTREEYLLSHLDTPVILKDGSTATKADGSPMTDEEKKELVKEVMDGFDFKTVQLLIRMQGKERTIEELKEDAERKLRMTLDHRDREFWWAGGMHHGGIAACYDNVCGLSLNYIAVANKVRVKRI